MNVLGVRQVADLFKVKAETVYKWVASNEIPHRKIGGSIPGGGKLVFSEEVLMEWLAGSVETVKFLETGQENALEVARKA